MSQNIVVEKELFVNGKPSRVTVFDGIQKSFEHLHQGDILVALSVGEKKKTLFELVANGEQDDIYLEIVQYDAKEKGDITQFVESSFSDCIYEMPAHAEEAIQMVVNFASV